MSAYVCRGRVHAPPAWKDYETSSPDPGRRPSVTSAGVRKRVVSLDGRSLCPERPSYTGGVFENGGWDTGRVHSQCLWG